MVKLRKDRVNAFIKALNPISDSACIKRHSFEAKILKHVRSFAEENLSLTGLTTEIHCPIKGKDVRKACFVNVSKLHNPEKMFLEAFISSFGRNEPFRDATQFAPDVNRIHVAPS